MTIHIDNLTSALRGPGWAVSDCMPEPNLGCEPDRLLTWSHGYLEVLKTSPIPPHAHVYPQRTMECLITLQGLQRSLQVDQIRVKKSRSADAASTRHLRLGVFCDIEIPDLHNIYSRGQRIPLDQDGAVRGQDPTSHLLKYLLNPISLNTETCSASSNNPEQRYHALTRTLGHLISDDRDADFNKTTFDTKSSEPPANKMGSSLSTIPRQALLSWDTSSPTIAIIEWSIPRYLDWLEAHSDRRFYRDRVIAQSAAEGPFLFESEALDFIEYSLDRLIQCFSSMNHEDHEEKSLPHHPTVIIQMDKGSTDELSPSLSHEASLRLDMIWRRHVDELKVLQSLRRSHCISTLSFILIKKLYFSGRSNADTHKNSPTSNADVSLPSPKDIISISRTLNSIMIKLRPQIANHDQQNRSSARDLPRVENPLDERLFMPLTILGKLSSSDSYAVLHRRLLGSIGHVYLWGNELKLDIIKSIHNRYSHLDYAPRVLTVNARQMEDSAYGETERRWRGLFDYAVIHSPVLLIIESIDEILGIRSDQDSDVDGLTRYRHRVVATLLTMLDGMDSSKTQAIRVLGLGEASPSKLDPAAVRPGRLSTWLEWKDILSSQV